MDHNQDAHRQRILDWINDTNGTTGAFDVSTKGILHSVYIYTHTPYSLTPLEVVSCFAVFNLVNRFSLVFEGSLEISWWKGDARIFLHPDSTRNTISFL
ncbi:putative alpha-amylase [Helianthus annuus]|nr:putative alpha-amylase [Helianthus annuus]